MHLNFKKLEIHNFMSFGDEVISFEGFDGIVKINGFNYDDNQKNGSGKSSIANALVYGLYGQLPFKLKNENVYNRYLKDHNTRVCVYLDSDHRSYKLVTGLKGKQSYCELYEIIDGEEREMTKSSISETRDYIEREILNCDLKLFMRTVFLNSDQDYNFYNLKAADKKDFIDKMFNLTVFSNMFAIFHKNTLGMEKTIASDQSKLMVLNNSKEEYKTKISEFDKNRETNIVVIKNKISEYENVLVDKKGKTIKRNTELISKCEEAIKKMNSKIDSIDENFRKNNIALVTVKNDIKHLETDIRDKRAVIKKHSELSSKLCDDCRGIYTKYHNLDKYEAEIKDIEDTKLVGLNEKLASLSEKGESMKNERCELMDKLTKLSDKLNEHNSAYNMEMNTIRGIENDISVLKSRLSDVENSVNPYIALLESNQSSIDTINSELDSLISVYTYKKGCESIVAQDTMKKFVVSLLIDLLNNRIKYYLHKLGASYEIVFDNDMDYDFITAEKEGIEYNNFSKGEQARINIATCFAFRDFISMRSNISSNLFILDEFFDSNVDTMALDNVVDILKEFVNNNKQKIFVVTHRQEVVEDIFSKIIQVEKKNHVSKVKIIENK